MGQVLARVDVCVEPGDTATMELGALVPTAPPSLRRTLLEVGVVGGALWAAVAVESSPRPPAFEAELATELRGFLQDALSPDEVRLVSQVVGALCLRDPDLHTSLQQRLLALEAPLPARLAA